jgi:hypothetical protein
MQELINNSYNIYKASVSPGVHSLPPSSYIAGYFQLVAP